jgi:hypothetical protein
VEKGRSGEGDRSSRGVEKTRRREVEKGGENRGLLLTMRRGCGRIRFMNSNIAYNLIKW